MNYSHSSDSPEIQKVTALINARCHYEALNLLDELITMTPNDLELYSKKAEIFITDKKYYKAIHALTYIIDHNVLSASARMKRAICYGYVGKHESALMDKCACLILDPYDAIRHHNYGVTLYSLNRYEDARVAFDEAIELDKAYDLSFFVRSKLRFSLKDITGGFEDIDTAIQISPNNSGYILMRARKHLEQGNYQESESDYSRYFEIGNPGITSALEFAELLILSGEHQKASNYLIKVWEEHHNTHYLYLIAFLGEISRFIEKKAGIFKVYRSMRIAKKSNLRSWSFVGIELWIDREYNNSFRGFLLKKVLSKFQSQNKEPLKRNDTSKTAEFEVLKCFHCSQLSTIEESSIRSAKSKWAAIHEESGLNHYYLCTKCGVINNKRYTQGKNSIGLSVNDTRVIDIDNIPKPYHTVGNIKSILVTTISTDSNYDIVSDGQILESDSINKSIEIINKHTRIQNQWALPMKFYNFLSALYNEAWTESFISQMERYMDAELEHYECPICGGTSTSSDWCPDCGNDY
jgi:tetratricopeptide (TPR) repeat protein